MAYITEQFQHVWLRRKEHWKRPPGWIHVTGETTPQPIEVMDAPGIFQESLYEDADSAWEENSVVLWRKEFSWMQGLWNITPESLETQEERWEAWYAPPPWQHGTTT